MHAFSVFFLLAFNDFLENNSHKFFDFKITLSNVRGLSGVQFGF